jgi:haloalkane dehalogenase
MNERSKTMYLYVELWKPREAWKALPVQERSNYMSQLGPAIGELTKIGVELIGWSLNDSETSHRADYHYIAVWKMPSQDAVRQFEHVVEQSGWYRYFEQVNARGELVAPDPVIANMIKF